MRGEKRLALSLVANPEAKAAMLCLAHAPKIHRLRGSQHKSSKDRPINPKIANAPRPAKDRTFS